MSVSHRLPQYHFDCLHTSAQEYEAIGSHFSVRPNIADRFSQLMSEIENFLLACTYEEACNFWQAIADLRQCLQKNSRQAKVPQFLTDSRKQRKFCRILEVLVDLSHPKLHLSEFPFVDAGDRSRFPQKQDHRRNSAHPHIATFR
jgi:hypothetical protein